MLKLIVAFAAVAASNFAAANRVVCYYDSRSIHREGPGRMIPSDIDPVLSYCTHLIYGYAKIDSHQKIAAVDESLDLSSGKDNYRAITALKKRFPQVKFLLSVGGGADLDDADKYNKILEDSSNRAQFVHSVKAFLKRNDFDGLDLSWQLPEIYKKKDRGTFGSIWHGVKKTFGYAHSHKDEKADEHREGFTKLVQDLKKELRDDNLLLTATVLSNVNASLYFEADKLAKEIDQIHHDRRAKPPDAPFSFACDDRQQWSERSAWRRERCCWWRWPLAGPPPVKLCHATSATAMPTLSAQSPPLLKHSRRTVLKRQRADSTPYAEKLCSTLNSKLMETNLNNG